MPSTHAPRITVNNERVDTGNPENGTIIVKMPIIIRMLGRDIKIVYQDSTITTNSPRIVSWCTAKCASNSSGVPEITSS